MESCSDTCWCKERGQYCDWAMDTGEKHLSEEEYLARLEQLFTRRPDRCRNCGIDNPVEKKRLVG